MTTTTTGYGDLYPQKSGERVVASVVAVLGQLLFGYVLGVLAASMVGYILNRNTLECNNPLATCQTSNEASMVRFREHMSAVCQFLTEHRVHPKLIQRTERYLEARYSSIHATFFFSTAIQLTTVTRSI